jgi:hypothetical protein
MTLLDELRALQLRQRERPEHLSPVERVQAVEILLGLVAAVSPAVYGEEWARYEERRRAAEGFAQNDDERLS